MIGAVALQAQPRLSDITGDWCRPALDNGSAFRVATYAEVAMRHALGQFDPGAFREEVAHRCDGLQNVHLGQFVPVREGPSHRIGHLGARASVVATQVLGEATEQ